MYITEDWFTIFCSDKKVQCFDGKPEIEQNIHKVAVMCQRKSRLLIFNEEEGAVAAVAEGDEEE